MKRIAHAVAISIALVSAAVAQTPFREASTRDAANANRGRQVTVGGLYGGQRIGCVQCHGLNGAGDSSGAFPALGGQSAWYLYKSLRDYAAGLRPSDIMGPIAATLSEQEMRDVAAHYESMAAVRKPSGSDTDISVLQIGGAIAAAGIASQGVPACQGCHGAQGAGAPPIYPSLAGQYALYTRHQLTLWKAGKRGGDPMNIMELIAKAMTDEQIEAVARYYAAVTPASGERRQRDTSGAISDIRNAEPLTGSHEMSIIGLPSVRNSSAPSGPGSGGAGASSARDHAQ